MQTSVSLQEMYRHSPLSLLLIVAITIGFTVYLYYSKKPKDVKKLNDKEKAKILPEKNKNIPVIKSKYLKKLESVESNFKNGKIELRKAYQSISEIVRMFVFEVTDIQTQNYTLDEIKKLNMGGLTELIEEFYEPEFAQKSIGDFDASIEKARSIIKKWN